MRAGLTRASVVALAADLADERGRGEVTVSSVARAAGVRPPSIYSHLDGADDLHAGVTALALGELADRVDRALAGTAGRDALVALADAHRDYAHGHPGRWAAAAALDVPLTPELVEAAARHSDHALAVLRGYDIDRDTDDAVHASRLLGSTVRGFVELERSGAFAGRDTPVDDSWRRALVALDGVLNAWATTPVSTR